MSEQIKKNLFTMLIEPTSGTKEEKGSGIGLSLSKEIADAIGMILGYRYHDGQHVFFLEKKLKL